MVDLTISRQRWTRQATETVDGAAWRCEACGWLGEHFFNAEGALREGMHHFAEQHPEAGSVDVEYKSVGVSDGS